MHEAVTAGAGPLPAGHFTTLVRVHADRVHDFVRRQGCPPDASADAVETSAMELLHEQGTPARLVGRWFALAREAALERVRRAGPTAATWLPVGRGLLAEDGQQELLAAAMDRCEPRRRAALLLRDAYDLPAESVAAALGLDGRAATDLVGQARLELLPDVFSDDPPARPGHAVDGPALARLAEGAPGPDDGPAQRHVRTCPACAELVSAQQDVRRLLSGLAVVALPDDARDPLLGRVARAARAHLPPVALAPEEEDEPRRLLSAGPVVFCLLLAVLAGVGFGAWLSRPTPVRTAPAGLLAPVVAPSVTPMPVPPVPSAAPAPVTTVFTFPPTAPPTTTPPPPPPPSSPPPTSPPPAGTVTVTPRTGAAGAPITVSGTGWTPGSAVEIALLDDRGTPVGDPVPATVGPAGRFRTSLPAGSVNTPPGTYTVTVGDGTRSRRATYTVLP